MNLDQTIDVLAWSLAEDVIRNRERPSEFRRGSICAKQRVLSNLLTVAPEMKRVAAQAIRERIQSK